MELVLKFPVVISFKISIFALVNTTKGSLIPPILTL